MKKSLIAAAVLSASAIAAPALAAPATGGQYFGVQAAISDVGGAFDSGLSFVGTYGMPLPQVDPHVAFEAELSKSLINPEYNAFGWNGEASYWTLAGYGVYNIPANQNINIRLRGGLAYERITFKDPTWLGTINSSYSELGLSVGLGVTVKMGSGMNFIAEYTDIDGDISHLSAGVQVNF